ncbi:MAG: mechanosensitive ion channel family protein [Mycobacterium sp.]|nr:mechanosensitive ion channel family protein [Mycobacterium sp.]
MGTLTSQPWFWPALAVVVGLPLALLVFNELQGVLVRRGSAYAKPVGLLRNWLLPAGAVYLLIDQLNQGGESVGHATWAKIAATVVGFVIMLVLLSGANAALFGAASAGSWRSRLPGIFVDLGRLILIIIGIGLLLSWVWGANIGGLITAVGVTSIVIGLAVQNAVGPVISGLLLLFEQPFRIGDHLDTKFGKGRVAEVNWRAVHIDTENGIQIVPNAALAGDAFVNLSRTTAPFFKSKATFSFAAGDPPGRIKATLQAVADGAPAKLADAKASVTPLGAHAVHPGMVSYRVMVPVASPAEADGTVSLLQQRVWYACQRSGLHLDNVKSGASRKRAYLAEHIGSIAAGLGLGSDAAAAMLANARVLPYAEGEIIQPVNSVPEAMGFITEGAVGMFAMAPGGGRVSLGDLGAGDYIGGTSLTRQRMITGVVALTDTMIVSVSRDAMNAIVENDHRLARQIGDAIEIRRRAAREALAEIAQHGVS